ncbi:8 TM domain-containing transmembrane protein [Acrasis kona]|uniref:8 TM domain-containing transmembrane protein n=1 Tax=Acrasis kona TaxID=1008807 RepID=A0AAW2YWQ8_9EUKA
MSSSRSRQKTYVVLIDKFAAPSIIITTILLLAAIACSAAILVFAPPVKEVYEEEIGRAGSNSGIYFLENSTIRQDGFKIGILQRSHQEISFSLLFKETDTVKGIDRAGLVIETEVSTVTSDNVTEIVQPLTNHTRPLKCSNNNYFCDPIITFFNRFLLHDRVFIVNVRIEELEQLYKSGQIEDVIYSRIEITHPNYTIFETIIRSTFVVTSIIVLFYYAVMLFRMQTWSYCRMEQKWILVLLTSLTLFNNPFFIGTWLTDHVYTWLILNIFFQSTTICLVLLFVLITSHVASQAIQETRTFVKFYLPKLFLVGCLWIFITVTSLWERFNQMESFDQAIDPTMTIPFAEQIDWVVTALSIFIVIVILYYIVRAVIGQSMLSKNNRAVGLSYSYYRSRYSVSNKYKFFLCTTLIMVFLIGGFYLSLYFSEYANSAVQHLCILPLINYYVITMALFFLPSTKIEEMSVGGEVVSPSFFGDDEYEDEKGTLRLSPRTPEDYYSDDELGQLPQKKKNHELIDVHLDNGDI